jgi:hypothetical protein
MACDFGPSKDEQGKGTDPPFSKAEVQDNPIDFKLYLDAVNAGSQRTRSTLYVLVAILVIILTAYRNTSSPDFLDARLAHFQMASACIEEMRTIESECPVTKQPPNEECKKSIDYSIHFLFTDQNQPILLKKEFCNELDNQINALIGERTAALSLRLPFFGMVIDSNDLGMINGIFLAFLLYVLYAGLDREIDNLERALREAKKPSGSRKQKLELLLMTQVLASRRGVTIGVHIMLAAIFLIQGYVVLDDLKTVRWATSLQGPTPATLETMADVIFFGIVSFFCIVCWQQQRTLDRKVDNLIRELESVAH